MVPETERNPRADYKPTDLVALLITAAVEGVIAGNQAAAEAALLQVDREALVENRKRAWEAARQNKARHRLSGIARVRVERFSVTTDVENEAYRRDRYTCRYCGRQTVHRDVLKLLSGALPGALPYRNGQWTPLEEHIVYWTYSTSTEHHLPLARGGTNERSNIVTTCYQCNDVKNDYLIEELGWTLLPPANSGWGGLAERLPSLQSAVEAMRTAQARPFTPAVREAYSAERNLAFRQRSAARAASSPSVADFGARTAGPLPPAGALVQLTLPGKKSRRNYCVEAAEAGHLTLREMWRREQDKMWVASTRSLQVNLQDVPDLRIVRVMAPAAGSRE